jgi:hypothetical protein
MRSGPYFLRTKDGTPFVMDEEPWNNLIFKKRSSALRWLALRGMGESAVAIIGQGCERPLNSHKNGSSEKK